jgi:hypothetical protein
MIPNKLSLSLSLSLSRSLARSLARSLSLSRARSLFFFCMYVYVCFALARVLGIRVQWVPVTAIPWGSMKEH